MIIPNGITVTAKSTSLKIFAAVPSNILLVKSRVYNGKDPAACSKAAQKKTVKIQKMAKAIIRSRSIRSYLGIRITSNTINVIAAINAKNKESGIPATVKFNT